MKKQSYFLVVVSAALLLSGCATSGSVVMSPSLLNGSKNCSYSAISGNEYKLSELTKQYPSNKFFFDASTDLGQLEKSSYADLVNGTFKVVDSGIMTAHDTLYASIYEPENITLNGVPYKKEKSLSTKLVTSSCTVFYLRGSETESNIRDSIVKSNGKAVDDNDVKTLIGDKTLSQVSFTATKKYDRFTKSSDIETEEFNGMLIRGLQDKDGRLVFTQLYTDLTFTGDWGNINAAIDEDGKMHEIKKINTDADCSGSYGCKLTETVGVLLTKDFLIKHKNGFDIKFIGSLSKIVSVPKPMISAYLSAIN